MKDGDAARSTAECDGLSAIPHVEVYPAPADSGAGVHHDIGSVVSFVESADSDPRTDRQKIRIGCNGLLGRSLAGCSHLASAVRRHRDRQRATGCRSGWRIGTKTSGTAFGRQGNDAEERAREREPDTRARRQHLTKRRSFIRSDQALPLSSAARSVPSFPDDEDVVGGGESASVYRMIDACGPPFTRSRS